MEIQGQNEEKIIFGFTFCILHLIDSSGQNWNGHGNE